MINFKKWFKPVSQETDDSYAIQALHEVVNLLTEHGVERCLRDESLRPLCDDYLTRILGHGIINKRIDEYERNLIRDYRRKTKISEPVWSILEKIGGDFENITCTVGEGFYNYHDTLNSLSFQINGDYDTLDLNNTERASVREAMIHRVIDLPNIQRRKKFMELYCGGVKDG